MPVVAVVTASLILAICAIAIAVFSVIWGRRKLSGASQDRVQSLIENLDRSLRDELVRSRQERASDAKLLREEITNSFGTLSDALRQSMSGLTEAQARQLEGFSGRLTETRTIAAAEAKALREEVNSTLVRLGETIATTITRLSTVQAEKLDAVTSQISGLTQSNESRHEAIRVTIESRLDALRMENAEKLEQMRQTVDEKLQGTLEQRLGASFKLVSEQLEAVHRGVGEMQALATGVGDLKKVLSNVKSRGTWGEVALGNLLEQVMAPDQYERNVEIKPSTGQRVEFAIRLPGDGDGPVWLPIDAKFPTGDYERLVDATERADLSAIEEASRALEARVRAAAQDICDKYVAPPHSTDFGILFVPTEGLYAEIIRRPGLIDALQREYRIVLAGPTTLIAILSSLRMGFRTLAIQRRSSEVWRVLAAVKTEFGKFEAVIDKVSKKLEEAQSAVAEVGTRRRVMGRKLRDIEKMPEVDVARALHVDVSLDELQDDDSGAKA